MCLRSPNWLSFLSLQVTVEELKGLISKFGNTDSMAQSGIKVAGTKYMYLSSTDKVIRAKKGTSGVHVIKTTQSNFKLSFLYNSNVVTPYSPLQPFVLNSALFKRSSFFILLLPPPHIVTHARCSSSFAFASRFSRKGDEMMRPFPRKVVHTQRFNKLTVVLKTNLFLLRPALFFSWVCLSFSFSGFVIGIWDSFLNSINGNSGNWSGNATSEFY